MIALLLLTVAAAAKSHAAPALTREALVKNYDAMFRHIDTDGDGKISRAEWTVMVDASPMLQSTSLSPAQREALRASLMAGFDQNDSDKDGFLTLDELLARPLVRFACLDANHDGKVTQTEAEAGMDKCSAPAGVTK